MNVYVVTKEGCEENPIPGVLGIFATKELAEKHITGCLVNTRKGVFNHPSQYAIIEEALVGEL